MKIVQHSAGTGGKPAQKDSEAGGRRATPWPRHRDGIGRLVSVAFLPICLAIWAACGASWSGSIGAMLAKDNRDGRVYVREAPSDMGAARAGVLVGDEITAIDGRNVRSMSPEQIHKALFGEVGTKVSLTISRSGVKRTIAVERGPLKAGDAGPGVVEGPPSRSAPPPAQPGPS